jgi:hypothetical protein
MHTAFQARNGMERGYSRNQDEDGWKYIKL